MRGRAAVAAAAGAACLGGGAWKALITSDAATNESDLPAISLVLIALASGSPIHGAEGSLPHDQAGLSAKPRISGSADSNSGSSARKLVGGGAEKRDLLDVVADPPMM